MKVKAETWTLVGKIFTAIVVPGGFVVGSVLVGRWAYKKFSKSSIKKGEIVTVTDASGKPVEGYALPVDVADVTTPFKVIVKTGQTLFNGAVKAGETLEFTKPKEGEDIRKVTYKGKLKGVAGDYVVNYKELIDKTVGI